MFSFSVGPPHARIDDFEAWYSGLNYDPKKPSFAQRQALRKVEADNIAQARLRMTRSQAQRHLLQLSSALRADLEIFVNHLLDAGGRTAGAHTSFITGPATDMSPAAAAAAEAAALTKEAFLQLKSLFDILDVDSSGTLTYDELQRASVILGRERYDQAAFRNLDHNRSGSIDFLEMLKVFFPRLTQRYLVKCNREYIKYADAIKSVRDRLAPEYLAQIDSQYARITALPGGGCTVDNILHFMSPYMKRHRSITEEVFATFDTDGDGELTLIEFSEMVKFSYPPYSRGPPTVGSEDGAAQTKSEAPVVFSLEQFARRRLVDPKQIRLPQLATYQPERPHVLNPIISGAPGTRHERTRRKLERIMGKAAVEKHSGSAIKARDGTM
jgi:Ca2+-binding EF-hand superfamily protein